MYSNNKILVAIMGLSLAFGTASTASAAKWAASHPRRAEVNGRLANQNRRIDAERKDGDITKAQAQDLHAEDRGIRGEERLDASNNNTHITRSEGRSINQQENAVSQQIGH